MLGVGTVGMLALAFLCNSFGVPRVAAVIHDVVVFTSAVTAISVGAWFIGKGLFGIETTM